MSEKTRRPGGQKQELTNLWQVLTESNGWADSGYTHNCGTKILIKASGQTDDGCDDIPYCPRCETEPIVNLGPISSQENNKVLDLRDRVTLLVHQTILRLSRWRDEELDNSLRNLENYLKTNHPAFHNYVDFLYRYDLTNKLIALEKVVNDLTADKLSRIKIPNIAPVDLLELIDEKLRAIWNNRTMINI